MSEAARSSPQLVRTDSKSNKLTSNALYWGDSRELMRQIAPESVAVSFWSPPYHVGKEYERGMTFEQWQELLRDVIQAHASVLIPGGFMVVNIADILCFRDPVMPRIQAPVVSQRRSPVTREQVLEAKKAHPLFNRDQLAAFLGCSEQTIDRRLNGNNIRGGKYDAQTRVQLVGHLIDGYARASELYLYDRRIWAKDPTWANSQWHSSSYRAVSEYEDLYIFWKPGETVIDRRRLSEGEWAEWGSRQIWFIRSVQRNDDHPAKFPLLLAKRVIRLYSNEGGIVLDPFLGSGTTAVAAIQAGRRYIGIEKEKQHYDLAVQNVEEANASLFKSDA